MKVVETAYTFFLPRFSDNNVLLRLLIMANLLALFLALVPMDSLATFSWDQFFIYAFFLNWVAVSFAIIADSLRRRLMRVPRLQAALLCFFIIAVIVTVYTVLINQLEIYVHLILPNRTVLWNSVVHNLLLAVIVGGVLLHYLYIREQLIVRERAELSARLDTLQARIRPHFLFNSMNTLLSLIETDSRRAGAVVENLSALFRASLRTAGEVALYDEVILCRRYLAIEALRLGDRLQVEWNVPDEDVLQLLPIPSLTLQPLLENAVVHGVEPSAKPNLITVFIEWQDNEVKILVTNPFAVEKSSLEPKSSRGNQMALTNIHERLQAKYGPTARLTTLRAEGFFTAYLSYPYAEKRVNT